MFVVLFYCYFLFLKVTLRGELGYVHHDTVLRHGRAVRASAIVRFRSTPSPPLLLLLHGFYFLYTHTRVHEYITPQSQMDFPFLFCFLLLECGIFFIPPRLRAIISYSHKKAPLRVSSSPLFSLSFFSGTTSSKTRTMITQ